MEEIPLDLKDSGRALWLDVTASRTLSAANRVQLLNACRITDRLDDLTLEIGNRLTSTNHRGDEIINPLISEHRQQFATLNSILSRMGLGEVVKVKTVKASVGDQMAQKRAERAAKAAGA